MITLINVGIAVQTCTFVAFSHSIQFCFSKLLSLLVWLVNLCMNMHFISFGVFHCVHVFFSIFFYIAVLLQDIF